MGQTCGFQPSENLGEGAVHEGAEGLKLVELDQRHGDGVGMQIRGMGYKVVRDARPQIHCTHGGRIADTSRSTARGSVGTFTIKYKGIQMK